MGAIKPVVRSHFELVEKVERILSGHDENLKIPFGDKFKSKALKAGIAVSRVYDITDRIVQATRDAWEEQGSKIACQDRCPHCCYQPVISSVFEAITASLYLGEDGQKKFFERYSAWRKSIDHESLNRGINLSNLSIDWREIQRYYDKGIACPFLEEDSCSIYEARPLSCRSMLSATKCGENDQIMIAMSEGIEKIQERMPVIYDQLAKLFGLNFTPFELFPIAVYEFSKRGEGSISQMAAINQRFRV